MRLRARASVILVAGLLPVLAGCSTSRMTVDLMVPVLENTTEVALRTPDAELVGDALPTSILLLEGMLETHPHQKDVARMAAMFRFAYGFGFVEDKDPKRASEIYDTGRELAWRAFGNPKLEHAIREGTFEEMNAALAKVKPSQAEALLWVAANWGMWIQLNLTDTRAVADVARVMPLAERVADLDDTLFWGMPRILLGTLQASRPVMLGGAPESSRKEFERAFEISHRNLLMAQVFFAKSYCVLTFDADAFASSLHEVLDAPAGVLPAAALLNQIARVKARSLLDREEEIFD